MDSLLVAYEMPSVQTRYFQDNVRHAIEQLKEVKVIFLPIDSAYPNALKLPYATDSVVITNEKIPHPFDERFVVDGFGANNKHLAVITYQKTLRESLFLLIHELGHLYGLPHCSNKCVMGIINGNYVWKRMHAKKKIDRRMICVSCRNALHYSVSST